MNLPIKFPRSVEIIAEEAARFRALSPGERVRSLDEMFRLYQFLVKTSGRPGDLARVAQADEERTRMLIEEFVTRHG